MTGPLTAGHLPLLVFPPEWQQCFKASSSFDAAQCFLLVEGGPWIPPGDSDASCAACAGWDWFRTARRAYTDAGIPPGDMRAFRARVIDNKFTARMGGLARWRPTQF